MKKGITIGICSVVFIFIIGFVCYSVSQNKKMKEYQKIFDTCDITCKSLPSEVMQKSRLSIRAGIVNLKENIGRPLSDEQLRSVEKIEGYKMYMPDGYWRDLCTCECDVKAKSEVGFFKPKSESEFDIVKARADKSEYSFNCTMKVQDKYFKVASEKMAEAEKFLDSPIMKKRINGCVSEFKDKKNSVYIESICRCVMEDIYVLGDSNSFQEIFDVCSGK